MDLTKYPKKLAGMIDYTNLKRDANKIDIKRLCDDAKEYYFKCVVVNPSYVRLCKELLDGSDVNICTVVGFPLGANTSKIKFFEAKDAIENGADEIDMVMNTGAFKSGLDDYIKKDINGVMVASGGQIVKVIIETALLSREEKIRACEIVEESGAHFVKSSTGFGAYGATVDDISLMKESVGENMGIKASGGIKDLQTALDMIEAGATRIGTSSGTQIMEEVYKKLK
jgi:deoxyribose-phosphate aldolase